jgi:protein arginine kinase
LTQVINDEQAELHLCKQCAEEKGLGIPFGALPSNFGAMVVAFLGAQLPGGGTRTVGSPKCEHCGITKDDFERTGLLGCGECYETFHEDLKFILRRIHGSNKHIGTRPPSLRAVKEHPDIEQLRQRLQEAVANERFEEAAQLRDLITDLEVQHRQQDTPKHEPEEVDLQTRTGVASTEAIAFLQEQLGSWLGGDGPESDIVITSRVRLARNLRGACFPGAASPEQREQVYALVAKAIGRSEALARGLHIRLDELSALDRRFLVERRLISPQCAEHPEQAAVFADRAQSLAVMVNEEDHLRLQAIASGLQIDQAWDAVSRLDDELGEELEYDFSEQFGYLTACPTNTGTGMRVSIFVHLPGLTILEQVNETLKGFAGSEITVRGFHGEGSRVQGNIFQISNQLTLGRAEKTILKRVQDIAERLVALEREARRRALEEKGRRVRDLVDRATALLRHAQLISSLELVNLLSAVRLGSELGLLPPIPRNRLNELLVIAMPGHLQKRAGAKMEGEDRDAFRAQLVRSYLSL